MSSRFHPRAPAFAGLRPPEPRFAATSPATRDALGAVAGPGDWLRMEGRRTEPDGYYRLIDRAGSGLFVKVVPDAHAGRQLSADRLSEELGSLGIPVSLLLPGFPRPLGTGHSVFAYAHLRSRFAAASEGELFRVGACVARLHLAMARVQGRAAIRIAGEAKIGALLSRRDLILRGASAGPAPEKLRRMHSLRCRRKDDPARRAGNAGRHVSRSES